MTAAEAYEEARRRIQAAKATGQHWLDLGDIYGLEQIPAEIAELRELRILGIGSNKYDPDTGTWDWYLDRWFQRPLSDLSPLGSLTALQMLDVSHTKMSDLSLVGSLTALQMLDVSHTEVSDLSPLGSLSTLQTLHVSGTMVSDLSPLGSLSTLQTLHVSGTKVSDLSPLGNLSILQTLDATNTPVSNLTPLRNLTALQRLHVNGTKVNDLTPLRNLTALQTLMVSHTSVSNLTPLRNLTALQTLDVSYTPVSDLSLLGNLGVLQTLTVSRTQVNDLSPLRSLSKLQTLHVSGTKVSDLSPLSGLSVLQTLDVSDTKVSDLSPLRNLTALQTLDVRVTKVTDLTPLSGLSVLQTLEVTGTKVNDLSPLGNLSALQTLHASYTPVSNLTPLRKLSALQTLHVTATNVSDLSPLGNLSALQTLHLSHTQVSDLSPLGSLSDLLRLFIDNCQHVVTWDGLLSHPNLYMLSAVGSGPCLLTPQGIATLASLTSLYCDRMEGVPPEVLSEDENTDCLTDLRSWAADLRKGEARDQEVKVFVLGNGTAGKTQICRQLRGEAYDEQVPSTHGVQVGHFDLLPDTGQGATQAKLWDFGGQDIYHGTHALFLEGRAVFILVWSREVEAAGDYEESGLSMHHHRLTYWLDYVRSLAGKDAALIVVQAKCDRESDRAPAPLPPEHGFQRPLSQVTCSAKLGEMDELQAAIRSATRYLLEVHGSYRLPASWVAVRDRLRKLKPTHKTITREHFNNLCRETHGTSVPAALLSYLHRSGELFYREGLFKDEIVLDQEWAVRAIYAVLDRNGPCQVLKQLGGIFTLPLLTSLVWKDEFTEEEQKTLLGMMESCAICFPLDERYSHSIQRYALPDLLPLEAEVRPRVEALWRPDLPVEKVTLDYAFLHAGILREFLCQIGKLGGADAAYWRYGCCFYDSKTQSRARIRAESTGTLESPARGRIVIETCDGHARELLARLQKAITEIRIGQPPQVLEEAEAARRVVAEEDEPKPLVETLKIMPAPTAKPLIYLSYAWGGAKEELVDHLEARLICEGYDVKRDKRNMRPGDWISDFMREIGQAKRVCVVLSEKYMQSPYCMRELLYLYQSSCGEKADFLNRIVPLVLEDAKLSKTIDRLAHVSYWNGQLKELKDATAGLDPATWGGAGADMTMIQDFCHHTELMLRHVSDHLMPRGITDIEKDDFAAVLTALKAKT